MRVKTKLFAKKNHPILDNYKYEHIEVAKFLGYTCVENRYQRFVKMVKEKLKLKIHYIAINDEFSPVIDDRANLDEKFEGKCKK